MRLSFSGGSLKGRVIPPASKSYTHRAFLLAAMANGRSEIRNHLLSDDTEATLNACRSMGAGTSLENEVILVDGGGLKAPKDVIYAANSGTTMRIVAGMASMFDRPVRIMGDDSLNRRPMGPLISALESMGVKCESNEGLPPVTIEGPNKGGKVCIDGSVSSQFITSLMMVAPMLPEDTEIDIRGKTLSEPYLDVTVEMMREFGAIVERKDSGIHVKSGTGYKPRAYSVPSDFSSAAFCLVAGALGGEVTVDGLNLGNAQGDKRIIDILTEAGADVVIGDVVTVKKSKLKGLNVDIGDVPDLFPILAVLFSTAEGETVLHGAPQLRFKESDRIETTVAMLSAIGADAVGTDDGCIIKGRDVLTGGIVENKGDHRIMMAAAVASLVCDSPVTMDDVECCAVSYPNFVDHMRQLGMKVI